MNTDVTKTYHHRNYDDACLNNFSYCELCNVPEYTCYLFKHYENYEKPIEK